MRILLDTHIYLWAVTDDPKLSWAARNLIVGAEAIFISVASIWEAAIKAGIGKLDADIAQLVAHIASSGFVERSC